MKKTSILLLAIFVFTLSSTVGAHSLFDSEIHHVNVVFAADGPDGPPPPDPHDPPPPRHHHHPEPPHDPPPPPPDDSW